MAIRAPLALTKETSPTNFLQSFSVNIFSMGKFKLLPPILTAVTEQELCIPVVGGSFCILEKVN